MSVYTDPNGITHIRFRDGSHYIVRNGNYTKIRTSS